MGALPALQSTRTKMGQQHRKIVKRRRRLAYIKRQKELRKNSRPSASVPLAKKISQPAEAVVVEKAEPAAEPAKAPKATKTTKASTAKSAEAKEKKAPAKKAPAKKAPAKKAADKEAAPAPAAAAEA